MHSWQLQLFWNQPRATILNMMINHRYIQARFLCMLALHVHTYRSYQHWTQRPVSYPSPICYSHHPWTTVCGWHYSGDWGLCCPSSSPSFSTSACLPRPVNTVSCQVHLSAFLLFHCNWQSAGFWERHLWIYNLCQSSCVQVSLVSANLMELIPVWTSFVFN